MGVTSASGKSFTRISSKSAPSALLETFAGGKLHFAKIEEQKLTWRTSCVILDCAHVTIGDRVLFATGVSLITATHETSLKSRREGVEYAEPIEIGDDCWLGANVTVLPGVKIGKGCTIGAGAVVSKDIPDYSVAVGVPAKVIKKVDSVE